MTIYVIVQEGYPYAQTVGFRSAEDAFAYAEERHRQTGSLFVVSPVEVDE